MGSEPSRRLERILIIGAGLAGLALAVSLRKSQYSVVVVERDTALRDVGAGIQLPANSTRILSGLGVLEQIQKYSTRPQELLIRSFRGDMLFRQNLSPSIEQKFGNPHLLIHRAHLRRILFDAALAVGVEIKLGKAVLKIELDETAVIVEGEERISADLIVGADGEHSLARAALLGRSTPPFSSGDVVYRIAVPTTAMRSHDELRALIDRPRVHAWFGPESHAVCYQLSKGDLFNVVITLPEAEGAAMIGPRQADVEALRSACRSWDSRICKLLQLADSALKWTLLKTEALESWTNPAGKLIILGDAAHATLPYLAQGAALAFESAHILSQVLVPRPDLSAVPALLRWFSSTRIPRAAAVRARSEMMHDLCQLVDGPSQMERDRVLREEEPFLGFPNPWADPSWTNFMWGFDAEAEVQQIRQRCNS